MVCIFLYIEDSQMKSVNRLKFIKGRNVVEIHHDRDENLQPSKLLGGGDAVRVLNSNGRCVMPDTRGMSQNAAESKVRKEASRLAIKGWSLVDSSPSPQI